MSTTDELDDFDEVEEVATASTVEERDLEATGQASTRERARALFVRWCGWPTWARIVSVIVGAYVALMILGFLGRIISGGDSDEAAGQQTEATVPIEFDPLENLPELAPLVASQLREADLVPFTNQVGTLTADGTSMCDVFYGATYVAGKGDEPGKYVWSLTTPAWQAKDASGVALPSSRWPVRAFYGEPCNVADSDVVLQQAPTATAEAPTSSTSTTATTKPASPVSAG